MKTPTHVEFEDGARTIHVVPREGLRLELRPKERSATVREPDGAVWNATQESADRLRRELLGEGEPEAAAEPEFVAACSALTAEEWESLRLKCRESVDVSRYFENAPESAHSAAVVLYEKVKAARDEARRREDATP